MGNVAIVYASSAGRTGVIAQEIANSLGAEGCNARLIAVEHIGPKDWAALDAADTIVMGSPTYMGSVSAAFKGFMDESAGIWEARGWVDKLGAGFTVAGHAAGDKLATLMQLRWIHTICQWSVRVAVRRAATASKPAQRTYFLCIRSVIGCGSHVRLWLKGMSCWKIVKLAAPHAAAVPWTLPAKSKCTTVYPSSTTSGDP